MENKNSSASAVQNAKKSLGCGMKLYKTDIFYFTYKWKTSRCSG